MSAPIVACVNCGNTRAHRARGLCNRCYDRAWDRGGLHEFATKRVTVTDAADRAIDLLAIGETDRTNIAARLGMTLNSFERSMYRARRAGNKAAVEVLRRTARPLT